VQRYARCGLIRFASANGSALVRQECPIHRASPQGLQASACSAGEVVAHSLISALQRACKSGFSPQPHVKAVKNGLTKYLVVDNQP